VIEFCGESDLCKEPLAAQHRSQDLESDVAVVPQVMSEMDRRHATVTQLANEKVAVTQGFPQLTGSIGHSGGLDGDTLNLC
jgi:hypothetical protein